MDDSTGEPRQREAIERWAAAGGHEIVGWAVDLNVSRSVRALQAPELGPWLTDERAGEWDILAAWKTDRLGAGSINLNELLGWCEDHGKTIVSTSEHLDFASWVGRMVANVISGVAEGELEAIRERNADTYHYLRRQGRYKGGNPPFGYRAEKVEGEWRYVVDPDMAALARDIASRLIDGEPISAVCADLNRRGVLTPDNYHRQRAGKPLRDTKWRVTNLRRELTSPAIRGQVVIRDMLRREKGKPVYGEPYVLLGEDGLPVQRAEPVLAADTFAKLGEVLSRDSGRTRTTPAKARGLLLQVIHCGVCGQRMYHLKGRTAMYYRCVSATFGEPCGNRTIRVDQADEIVTESVMDKIGDMERHIRRFDPGDDSAALIADIDATLGTLVAMASRLRSGPALDGALAQIEALESQKAALLAVPFRPAGVVWEPTGQTFREWWERVDERERNMFLRDHKVRMDYKCPKGTRAVEIGLSMLYLDEMVEAVTGQKPTSPLPA